MPSEDAEQRVLQRPLAPVIVQYVLVVLQVLRQLMVLHQSSIQSLIRLRRLLLLIRLRVDSAGALGTSPAAAAHLRPCNGSEILAGKYLRIQFSGEISARSELSGRSGRSIISLEDLGDVSIYIHTTN